MRTILICADAASAPPVRELLVRCPQVDLVHAVSGYPDSAEVRRILGSHAVELIVLDFRYFDDAVEALLDIRAVAAGMPVIAVNPPSNNEGMLELMRRGIGEVLRADMPAHEVEECVARATAADARTAGRPGNGQVCCFVPGKPGSGTSMLAVNCALMMAEQTQGRVLLCDVDLACGTASHYLKVPHDRCIRHVAALGSRLNVDVWESLACERRGIDVLGAGAFEPAGHIDSANLMAAIEFLRGMYAVVCIDCSGALERWCVELLQGATHILLTTTVEPPAVQLTRAKARVLRDLELHRNASVLLTRNASLSSTAIAEFESLLGLPVLATFANDYNGVMDAFAQGIAVNGASELGKRISGLASFLLGEQAERPAKPRRRLLDLFARGN